MNFIENLFGSIKIALSNQFLPILISVAKVKLPCILKDPLRRIINIQLNAGIFYFIKKSFQRKEVVNSLMIITVYVSLINKLRKLF